MHVLFHRYPPKSEPAKRKRWLLALDLPESDIADHHRICSKHFPNGDSSQTPLLHLGKKFRSPKVWTARAQRAAKRSMNTGVPTSKRHLHCSPSPAPTVTPASSEPTDGEDSAPGTRMSTPVSEVLLSDCGVCELPSDSISHSDSLVHFYTGFQSYELLLIFFDFLGPVVNELNYWGSTKKTATRKRKTKIDPLNQLFLTLIKLRLNPRERDLAIRFEIAVSTVSKYFITWISFLYHHLGELQWSPSVEQVRGTLPQAFRERFPDTYAIVDATEIFIETPCDLQNQSSTWSNYKHNTAKFIVACTPNGAISFVSPLYVGSISDAELTCVSGFIESLNGKNGVSVMADRGFTIRDQLSTLGITLNIPPFMEGRSQLPANEVKRG